MNRILLAGVAAGALTASPVLAQAPVVGPASQSSLNSEVTRATAAEALLKPALVSVTARNPLPTDDYTAGYFAPNSVDELAMTNVGVGCTSTPTLAIAAPTTGGTQATGHLVMNGAAVLGAVVDNPGSNYLSVPTVTLTGGGCSTAPVAVSGLAQVGAFWTGPGGLYQMQQAAAGAAVWTKLPAAGLPLDSVINPVSAAVPVAGGTGYAVNDTITLANGTVLKVATISSGAVATVTVQTPGVWPCLTATAGQAQVSTSGSGTGATFSITIAGAQAAYGTKLLTVCYSANKALDVVRASDSVAQTIGFVRGALDMSTLNQFCSGTTCAISKFYDQSGNGNDGIQSTAANRPVVDSNWQIGGVVAPLYGAIPLPATLSTFSLSESLVWVGVDLGYLGGSNVISAGYLSISSPNLAGYRFAGSNAPTQSAFIPNVTPVVLAASVNSSAAISFSANDAEAQCVSNCTGSGSQTGGTVGGNSYSPGAMGAAIVANRPYSAAERVAMRAALYALYGLAPQVRDTVLFSGDSRTAGVNSTNNFGYVPQINAVSAIPLNVLNTGVSGDTETLRISRFYAADALPMLGKVGKNSWIVQWIGYNDLTNSNLAPSTVYASITTYIGMAHALGIKVALSTETEGGGTGGTYQQLNALIVANTAGADAIIPQMATDPVWQATGATPQHFIDGPHPTTYGYGFVASDIAAGLLPLFH